MITRAFAVAVCLSLVGGAATAHGPSRQKTDQEVRLDATPEEVWAVVGDFADMSWYPGVAAIELTGDKPPTEKGATRVRTMADGASVTEELTKYDPAKHAISVRVVEDNLAIVAATQYASHITVADDGGKAVLDWKGAFYRAFPLNDPPPEQNDEAAVAAVEAYHQVGLDALAERFGALE